MTDLDALLANADKHHVRPGDDECWECGSDTWPCDYVKLAAAVRDLRETP